MAKNMNVGSVSTGSSTGVFFGSRRMHTGVSLRSYSGSRQNVRGTVVDRYEGHFYLTSRRMVMVAYKGGFDVSLDKITSLEFYDDGFMLAVGNKSYLVFLNKIKNLKKVIEASNVYLTSSAQQKQQAPSDIEYASEVEFDSNDNLSKSRINDSDYNTNPPDRRDGVSSTSNSGNKVVLWILFGIFGFLSLFALSKIFQPYGLRNFLVFAPLAAGCLLSIDPLKWREKGKMLPASLTWVICGAIVAIAIIFLR